MPPQRGYGGRLLLQRQLPHPPNLSSMLTHKALQILACRRKQFFFNGIGALRHSGGLSEWLLSDKRAIFTAASHAQKAADYLHGLQPQEAQS